MFVIYADASYTEKNSKYGYIIKEYENKKLVKTYSGCGYLSNIKNPTQAEYEAAITALKTIKKPSKIIVYTDCRNLSDFAQNNHIKRKRKYHRKINKLNKKHQIEWIWIPREKQIAHDLAYNA